MSMQEVVDAAIRNVATFDAAQLERWAISGKPLRSTIGCSRRNSVKHAGNGSRPARMVMATCMGCLTDGVMGATIRTTVRIMPASRTGCFRQPDRESPPQGGVATQGRLHECGIAAGVAEHQLSPNYLRRCDMGKRVVVDRQYRCQGKVGLRIFDWPEVQKEMRIMCGEDVLMNYQDVYRLKARLYREMCGGGDAVDLRITGVQRAYRGEKAYYVARLKARGNGSWAGTVCGTKLDVTITPELEFPTVTHDKDVWRIALKPGMNPLVCNPPEMDVLYTLCQHVYELLLGDQWQDVSR